MRFYKNFRPLVLIGLVLQILLLSSCVYNSKPPVDIGDGGLLFGQPCSAPCFWNITPGVTTAQQAINILSSKLELSDCDRWDTRNSGGTRGMRCSDINVDFNGEDLVSGIGFSPSQNINVDEVIRKYGNPDGIFIAVLGIEMQPPVTALLYFNRENMIIHLPEQNSTSYNLQPNTPIERIVYLEQAEYETNKDSIQAWKGFGNY